MLSLPPSPALEPIAVPLVCPSCGQPLALDVICSCAAKTQLELWYGIPRLLFGQSYWGECSAGKMAAILARMDDVPWKQALEEVAADEAVHHHLCSDIGPDFVHSLPWNEIDTVLDVGSGMGFLTALLADRARQVIALEAVPERALFQRKRAAQDGFANWQPIIASATALPFPAETFDLITLNGVFEYIGLWGAGDPRQVQQSFLDQVCRLLRPNGFLYVGIETRFGLGNFLGELDHSGLAFTSLMPRWLADWYCRRRAVKFYGSEQPADGYRTYTYTPAQYERMFHTVGFQRVEVLGAHDGYNRQMALYRLSDARPRRLTRAIVDPAATWKGRLRRWLGNAGPWYHILENEVVVLGRKSADAGRLAWSGLPHDGPITQFSTSNKVFALCFTNDRPTSVFKAPKNADAAVWLAKEHAFLQAVEKCHGGDVERWPLRWPKPLGTVQHHGRTLYQYEYADGTPLTRLLLPTSFDAGRFQRLFAQLIERYIELCCKLTAALPITSPDSAWDKFVQELGQAKINDKSLSQSLHEACAQLQGKRWPLQVTHGDLSLSNTVVLASGAMVLIDWENAGTAGLVAIDLLRLLYDAWSDTALLKPKARQAVVARARQTTCDTLARLGVGLDDYPAVVTFFVAHQIMLLLPRHAEAEAGEVIQAYHQGVFALDQK